MNFASKLKNLRKKTGFSQEKLADKLGVSRQAVTKWETENGIPDIENIIAISKLFDVSIDDLLLDEEVKKEKSEYLFESVSEYDIDEVKQFDVKLGDAKSVFVNGYDGEKLKIKLSSNTLTAIAENLKVKLDDIKKRIDLEINQFGALTKAELKEALSINVQVPNRYLKSIELAVSSKSLELNALQAENIELNIKTNDVNLKNVVGNIEIDCNEDMQIISHTLQGKLSINQYLATSKLFIPEEIAFKALKKGMATKIYYEKNGEKVTDFSRSDADSAIEYNGIKSELIISRSTKGQN